MRIEATLDLLTLSRRELNRVGFSATMLSQMSSTSWMRSATESEQ